MSDSESPVTNGFGQTHAEKNQTYHRSRSQSLGDDQASGDDGDLFGDDDTHPRDLTEGVHRKLDDSELDSGDDEDRNDRVAETIEDDLPDEEGEKITQVVMGMELARVQPPEADELYLLNMPSFLGLKQKNFDPATYEAPRGPHDGSNPSTTGIKFSAFNTAATSIYWRRDPQHPSKVQSNARIVRWSDGSLTLQIASSPKDQYRVSATALRQSFDKKQAKPQATQDYDPSKDSQVYLAAPHAVANVYQIVAPLDAALRILPTGDQADESVLKLQQSLAAATNVHDPLSSLKQVKEDPELAKKAAELFEKDRIRANRRRDLAEEKLLTRKDRVLGRAGLSARGATGLSVAGLEGDDMPSGRGAKKKARRRRTNRRGEILSDDDEDEEAYRRRGREDEYDLADDFMAASDEEPEIYGSEDLEEDDPDVDDLEIEGRQTVIEGKTRGETLANRDRGEKERGREGTPKRPAEDEIDAIDEAGALAGLGSPQARKKRRVIDDDEDEE